MCFSPKHLDKTTPSPTSDAMTSAVNYHDGSGCLSTGAVVKVLFRCVNASSVAGLQEGFFVSPFNRVVKGAAMVLKPQMKYQ